MAKQAGGKKPSPRRGPTTEELATTPDASQDLPVITEEIPMARIIELYKKELTHAEIGAILGCSASNITQRLQRVKGHIDALPAIKNHTSDMLHMIKHKNLSELLVRNIKDESYHSLTVDAGIIYDKTRIEDDKSTINVDVHLTTTSKISDLEKRIAENRAQLGMMPGEEGDED